MGIFDRIKKTAEKFKPQYTLEELRERAKYRLSVKDYETAAEYLQQAADMGDAESQYKLAELCYDAKSELLSEKEVVSMYEKAAWQGHLKAQLKLANLYHYDYCDLEGSYPQAIYWCTKAVEQGSTIAMRELGDIYFELDDNDQALIWYQRAFDAGDMGAQDDIDMILNGDFDDDEDEDE